MLGNMSMSMSKCIACLAASPDITPYPEPYSLPASMQEPTGLRLVTFVLPMEE